jgi:hypothetical protein
MEKNSEQKVYFNVTKDFSLPKENVDSGYPGLSTIFPEFSAKAGDKVLANCFLKEGVITSITLWSKDQGISRSVSLYDISRLLLRGYIELENMCPKGGLHVLSRAENPVYVASGCFIGQISSIPSRKCIKCGKDEIPGKDCEW